MRIAALVKPIRDVRAAACDPAQAWRADAGHLVSDPFCRRAVAQACELAAAVGDGTVMVVALGPPSAERVVRQAVAAAAETDVACDGLLLEEPAADPVDVARLLAEAVVDVGGFDLVLTGRRGVDGDGGHIGPQVAARLDVPFVGAARFLSLQRSTLHVRCQLDDGWAQATVELPAVVSCAERLIEPSTARPPAHASPRVARQGPRAPFERVPPRARVVAARPRVPRQRLVLDGPPDEQVARAVEALTARGALGDRAGTRDVPPAAGGRGDVVAVVAEPARAEDAADLLGTAALLARDLGGHVVALGPEVDPAALGSRGADVVVRLAGSTHAEDVAGAVARWTADAAPVALLVTSTDWGREVAARVAVALDAAIAAGVERVAVDRERRLHVEAPALAGQLLVTTRVDARPAVVSVRPGSLPPARPRADADATSRVATVTARSRVRLRSRTRDPSLPALDRARAVVGVGLGVDVADYPRLVALLDGLRAELACTRPVVDRGWLPSGRQVGLTGRALTPNLYVALGVWGAFEHVVGVAGARTILAVHPARGAPVFDAADVGIVADWRDVIGPLAAALAR